MIWLAQKQLHSKLGCPFTTIKPLCKTHGPNGDEAWPVMPQQLRTVTYIWNYFALCLRLSSHPKQTHQLTTEWCRKSSLAITPLRQRMSQRMSGIHSGGYLQTAFWETGTITVPTLLSMGRKETGCNRSVICICWFESIHSFPSESVAASLTSNILRLGGELTDTC